jgi:hypothetical protein
MGLLGEPETGEADCEAREDEVGVHGPTGRGRTADRETGRMEGVEGDWEGDEWA